MNSFSIKQKSAKETREYKFVLLGKRVLLDVFLRVTPVDEYYTNVGYYKRNRKQCSNMDRKDVPVDYTVIREALAYFRELIQYEE